MIATDDYVYLGDGVYASFDGFQIWLRTQRESGWHEIALDAYTFDALLKYAEELKTKT